MTGEKRLADHLGGKVDRRTLVKAGIGLGALSMVSPLIAACGSGAKSGSNGKTFTYAYKSDVETLDPHFTTDTTTQNVVYQIFEPLATMGRDGKFTGVLAESWENPDDKTWKFQLRKNVKFHNGEVFDAQAVKYSFDRIRNPDMKAPTAPGLAAFDHIEVQDDYTVVLVTKTAYAATLSQLHSLYILPPKYTEEKGKDGFAANPVGTGPFKFVERQKDVHVKMEAFDGHWRAKPTISTLVFRPIPEDSSRIAALQNGEVDWIAAVDVDRAGDLQQNSKLQIVSRAGQGIYGGMDTLKFKPFMDKRVRQAMNYGINVDSIIKDILAGRATRLASVCFTETPGYDPNMKPYPYDPDKAKQLLAEAGYGNGFEVDFNLPVGIQATQKFKEVGEAIAQDLSKIGVKANIKVVDPATAFDHYRAKEFQFYIYPWASSHESGIYIETLLKSDTRGYYYQNPDADKIISQYMSTIDPQKRIEVGKQLNQFFYDDCPWVYMYQEPDIYGMSNHIDWQPNPYDVYFYAYEVKFK